MTKQLERYMDRSCWNKANEMEHLFILLARDAAAPYAIQEWCVMRIRLGLNKENDPQIQEALKAAIRMKEQRETGRFE